MRESIPSELFQHRLQDLGLERVAADAQVPVRNSRRGHGSRRFDEPFFIAMRALSVAEPRNDVVDRLDGFHCGSGCGRFSGHMRNWASLWLDAVAAERRLSPDSPDSDRRKSRSPGNVVLLTHVQLRRITPGRGNRLGWQRTPTESLLPDRIGAQARHAPEPGRGLGSNGCGRTPIQRRRLATPDLLVFRKTPTAANIRRPARLHPEDRLDSTGEAGSSPRSSLPGGRAGGPPALPSQTDRTLITKDTLKTEFSTTPPPLCPPFLCASPTPPSSPAPPLFRHPIKGAAAARLVARIDTLVLHRRVAAKFHGRRLGAPNVFVMRKHGSK